MLAISMRVFPAGARSCFVNGAVVVGSQKWTGCPVEYVIAIAIQVQVLLDQFSRPYSQVLGDSLA